MQEDKKYGLLKKFLSQNDYDYRKAYLDNQQPEINKADGQYHWASKDSKGNWLKSPDHPTAWKEVFMNLTNTNPDSIPMMTKNDADKILQSQNLPSIESQLPKEWRPISEFGSDLEPKFQKWLMDTEWFKNIYNNIEKQTQN
jgi:hypothetical protein